MNDEDLKHYWVGGDAVEVECKEILVHRKYRILDNPKPGRLTFGIKVKMPEGALNDNLVAKCVEGDCSKLVKKMLQDGGYPEETRVEMIEETRAGIGCHGCNGKGGRGGFECGVCGQ